jgi:hypothetical protein
LSRTLDFVKFSDTLWVVNTLSPGSFRLASSARRGPKKSPDYIIEDTNGNLSVLECKGCQSSRRDLLDAIQRGVPQKANIKALGATQFQHSLVAGLFIPQFDHADSAVLVVGDPEWDELKKRLSDFPREAIVRAITQVALSKELGMLELPNTANALIRAEGSEESIRDAIRRDLSWEQAPNRHLTAEGVSVQREYRWAQPAKVADKLLVSGIRFQGSLASEDVETLSETVSPAEYGEKKRDDGLGKKWILRQQDVSVSLRSPFGSTFELRLLEA